MGFPLNVKDLSEEKVTPPPEGQVTNDMLVAATQWPVKFDIRHHHIRCIKCQQSIMSMGKNGQGYTTNNQTILGLTVMHMIQTHQFTREGAKTDG